MRHIRARKRFTFILTLLLALSFALFFENKLESFAPQIKQMVELKVASVIGKDIKLSIGAISGGLVRPFMLNNVKITGSEGAKILSALEIKSIRSNYRIWDVLLNRKPYSYIPGFLAGKPRIYVNFATKDKEISGRIRFIGNIEKADIKGFVIVFGKERIGFSGKIKNRTFSLVFKPKDGQVRIEGELTENNTLVTCVKIDHLKIKDIDIVCDAVLKNSIVEDPAGAAGKFLEGEITTNSLIVNYLPFLDMKAFYKIRGGYLEISNIELGSNFKISGKVALHEPFDVDVVCVVDNINLGKVISSQSANNKPVLSGIMNGKFEIKGPVKDIKETARIEIKDGAIGTLDFIFLTATLKGDGPLVRIEDSRITRKSGFFSLAGDIDFTKIGRPAMFHDVELVTDDKAIMWDTWDMGKTQGIQGAKEVNMKKNVNEEFALGFKRFLPNGRVDESVRDTDEVAVEYKIHPNESLKMMVGQDKDFFGFEHKDTF
ncbi:MAG: hypothetical protein WC779_05275 [Candidatus Omnitrophota bacterium]|jgi:hypothetical protein